MQASARYSYRAGAAALILLLAGCAGEPRVVTRIQRVEVPVPVPCDADPPPPVAGPDFAPPDADVASAAKHVVGQVLRLRAAEQALRRALELCRQEAEKYPRHR